MKFTVCPSIPGTINNGTVTVVGAMTLNVPGTKVKFSCHTDFVLSTKVSEFVCGNSGTWRDYKYAPTCTQTSIALLFVLSFLNLLLK